MNASNDLEHISNVMKLRPARSRAVARRVLGGAVHPPTSFGRTGTKVRA